MENKLKCEYPGCKKDHTYSQILELTNEKGASVELGFCDYHYYIVMGGHFKAKIIPMERDKLDVFELVGPFKEIELIEQVMGAREMIASKLKSSKKK